MKHLFFCFIWMLLLSSCKKEGGSADPTLANNGFRGITETRDDPTPTGWTDPDDWKSDGYWNSSYPIASCVAAKISRQSPFLAGTSVHPIDIPTSNKVYPAFPNPCAPATSIMFDIAQNSIVYIAIIDDQYRLVAPLVCNRMLPAGTHDVIWDGAGANGKQVSSDVYRVVILVKNPDGGFIFSSHGDILVR